MESNMQDYTLPGKDIRPQPGFPHAPTDWSQAQAEALARADGLNLGEEHWEALRALQDYYARHGGDNAINIRELHDALDERFHAQGGIKRLFDIFPGGPVAQGCRLAGLQVPAGAVDRGFGSVV
jgi:TusE/DsrC/DsvC family sulfur relay protein